MRHSCSCARGDKLIAQSFASREGLRQTLPIIRLSHLSEEHAVRAQETCHAYPYPLQVKGKRARERGYTFCLSALLSR